ncbi:MAG: radical SAM protein [Nitrospirae bacterium]|nr:radical SAM protein [Nitrospirota bacterium]
MRLLLINPPIREWSKPNVFPIGLGYIASAARDAGHDVGVLDINAHRWKRDEVEERIKNAAFDVAGIGAIVTVYSYVKWLIEIIKKYHPDKKVVIGGSVGTSIPYIIMGKTKADIVCIGEGEATVVEMLDALSKDEDALKSVDGIWFRKPDGETVINRNRKPIQDIDSLPWPAWDLFPMDIYLINPVGAPNRNKWIDGGVDNSSGEATPLSMNMNGTRGCPYQCIYCYHDFMGQGYRHRSADGIIREMRHLYDKFGVRYFHFTDDEFCLKKGFVYDFCDKVKNEFGNGITWGCAGRVNLMTEDLIKAMAGSGCVLIGYGIESGSQRMLDVMKKGVTVEQAKEAIRLTKKHLGWADTSFMVGMLGENRETIQETIDFCKETDLAPEVIFFTTPYPGTELYQIALRLGKIADEEEYILNLGEQGEKIRVNFSELSDEELWKAQEYMIKELNAWNKIKHPESR